MQLTYGASWRVPAAAAAVAAVAAAAAAVRAHAADKCCMRQACVFNLDLIGCQD